MPPGRPHKSRRLKPRPRATVAGQHPITVGSGRTGRSRRSANWPGFRGADRSGVIRGVHIDTDWSSAPPTELWRRNVGPGWSSFAIRGDLLYTQEQRGSEEIVSAYRVSTGAPVWRRADPCDSRRDGRPRTACDPDAGRESCTHIRRTGLLNALDAATASSCGRETQ